MRLSSMHRFVLLAAIISALSGCTVATMTLPDGTRFSYWDLHPAGNTVDAEGTWKNVASFKIDRDSGDASDVAGAVAEGLVEGLKP